ncbi:Ankyrin repeat-containing domain [Phytophthora cactorum]|nr:Ankyrin repeat-containing domain [Phytophthora cactorum]
MNLAKPTALAAFAAKQQLLDDLSIPDGGLPGKTLAQLKIPSLKTLEGASDVGANAKLLKDLNSRGGGALIPRGDGRGSMPGKLVGMSTASTPMSPVNSDKTSSSDRATATASSPGIVKAGLKTLATADDDDNRRSLVNDSGLKKPEKTTKKAAHDVAASAADTPLTQDETTLKEREVIISKPDDSGEEDFNFDDIDEEEKNAKATVQPSEEKQSSPPPVTELRPTSGDVEDLYDCPPEASHNQQQREPKMFLPRASDIELFHLVLTEDADQLERYLKRISPQEILEIVDANERTLYHYAALSKDKLVRDLIFQHVSSYNDAQFEVELQDLMRKKAQMNSYNDRRRGKSALTGQEFAVKWTRMAAHSFITYILVFNLSYLTQPNAHLHRSDCHNNISDPDKFKKLALHYAVTTGNLKLVKWFFQMGTRLSQADVDLLLSFNVSRVIENVLLRQLEAIDFRNYHLPSAGPSVDGSDDIGDPGVSTFVLVKLQRKTDDGTGRLHQLPLHRAAMFGNIRAVELLLEEGADPNARDANKWTALHYCADEATVRHLSIAQLLVESPKPVDVNARSLKGRSPLHVAVRSRKPNNNGAVESQDRLSFVTYLHDCKADLDLKDRHEATPLLLACRGGDVGLVRFLLRAGCDPTATGDNKWNPLHFAAIHGNPSMVQFLLSWDADSRLWIDSLGIQGRKPVDVAKNDSIRQMLVNLWAECYNGNVDHVRRLLLARSTHGSQSPMGAGSVSVKDKTAQAERTPLHLAVLGYRNVLAAPSSSHEERLKHAKASELKRSAPSRYLQIVVLLLQGGANLSAEDKWGITPLMLAASIKDAIFMETLLDRLSEDNDLAVADTDGNTALHYSYAFCQDIENKIGKSPFEMTGYRDKIYPKEYREFQRQQQDLRKRGCK